jgi:flagellar hook-length control protein FliK
MSSDLFFSQLVAQSFSSGSSFGNVSNSTEARQLGYTTGNHDMAGGGSSFEKVLHHVSDTKTVCKATTSSGGRQAAWQEYAKTSAGPTDVSQEISHADNLTGLVHNHQATGDDGAIDPNMSAGMNMLMSILNELQNAFMLTHPPGLRPEPRVNETISTFSDPLATTGDQVAMSSGSNHSGLPKLEALLKQFEALGENKQAVEIRKLIEQFNTVSDGDTARILKTAELAKRIQNLAALSPNGLGHGDRLNQIARLADHLQALTTTASPPGSSDMAVQQGTSENANLEKNASGKTAFLPTTSLGLPEASPADENTNARMKVHEQTLSSIPEFKQTKNPMPGQNEITGMLLNKDAGGGFNHDNAGPVPQASSFARQIDVTLQNAKVVYLNTNGPPAEAVAGKMVNAESANQENGFSFTAQQHNEMSASERSVHAEQSEIIQKKFQTQTLDQIVQKAALHLKSGQNEVQINLKPDFLGQIRMQIITVNQQVTVRILTEFPMVKELIESNAHQLRSELQNYGLDIDELEVSVSQHSDRHVADQNRADGSAGKNGAEKKTSGEDGEPKNSISSSALSDSHDDGVNTKIDFFA